MGRSGTMCPLLCAIRHDISRLWRNLRRYVYITFISYLISSYFPRSSMFASFSSLHNYNYIGIRFVVCDKKCTYIEDKYIFYETIILLRFSVAHRILCDFSNLTKIMFHLSIPTLSYVSMGGTYRVSQNYPNMQFFFAIFATALKPLMLWFPTFSELLIKSQS